MKQADNTAKSEAVANYTARLPSDFYQTLRRPLTKAFICRPKKSPRTFWNRWQNRTSNRARGERTLFVKCLAQTIIGTKLPLFARWPMKSSLVLSAKPCCN